MSILAIAAALVLSGDEIIITERPAPTWTSQKAEAQCGLIVAKVEHKTSHNAKRPDVLKAQVSYGNQKRTLDAQTDAISAKVTGVRDIGIACESNEKLVITISTNSPSGEKVFEIYVDTMLAIYMVER